MTKQVVKEEVLPVEIAIIPDRTLEATRTYANFVTVSHSPFDFTLTFADAGPIQNPEHLYKTKQHRVPLVAELIIPIPVIPGLIKALQERLDMYNQQFGDAAKGVGNEISYKPKTGKTDS